MRGDGGGASWEWPGAEGCGDVRRRRGSGARWMRSSGKGWAGRPAHFVDLGFGLARRPPRHRPPYADGPLGLAFFFLFPYRMLKIFFYKFGEGYATNVVQIHKFCEHEIREIESTSHMK